MTGITKLRDASSRVDVDVHRMYTDCVGTKEDLINEGLATEDMFPQGRKRVVYNDEPASTRNEFWRMKRKKGGVYQLRRWHDAIETPEPPPEWNPAKFKEEEAHMLLHSFDVFILSAAGGFEEKAYGRRIHKFADADLDKLQRIREQLSEVLSNARVERGYRATVTPIKQPSPQEAENG